MTIVTVGDLGQRNYEAVPERISELDSSDSKALADFRVVRARLMPLSVRSHAGQEILDQLYSFTYNMSV